jgi:glycosyltransferase involved in cell wall biosynthesis
MCVGRGLRVVQSFPHKLGSGRIADTAWHQAEGAAASGVDLTVFPGVVHRPLSPGIRVRPTLARGRWRIPYRVGLLRALALHDHVVARRLASLDPPPDVVHLWPLAARKTLSIAKKRGVVTVLERPNAHTRYAYGSVRDECERLGIELPPGYEHEWNDEHLRIEEEEYELTDYLLCASEFSLNTFLDQRFPRNKLIRHTYGFDERTFFPPREPRAPERGITMLFAGLAAVRKGLHFALEAWLQSPASRDGTFLIAGDFLPAYEQKLSRALEHRSVRVLGHRGDVPDLMRQADVFVLPSIEEGFGLVCVEALATGCVPLVSTACTEVCVDGDNAFVHPIGDVECLTSHITVLHDDRELLRRMSARAAQTALDHTWTQAGAVLTAAYGEAVSRSSSLRLSPIAESTGPDANAAQRRFA